MNIGLLKAAVEVAIFVGGLIWAVSRNKTAHEASIKEIKVMLKNDIDKMGMRLDGFQVKYDQEVVSCKEKLSEVKGRVGALEDKDFMTVTEHTPLQATCRNEIMHMIHATNKKTEQTDKVVADIQACLHRLDINVAKLITQQKNGGSK